MSIIDSRQLGFRQVPRNCEASANTVENPSAKRIDYSLYLIADPSACSPRALLDAVAEIIDAGISCVQLRMKKQPLAEVLALAKQLRAFLKPRNIPLIINDYIDIVQAIDADGVHIGQTDQPYAWVRQQLGYNKIIGLSIENIQQAEHCKAFDCDYFAASPVFPTVTKRDASPALGIETLKQIISILPKPVVAIGGINESNIHSVLSSQVSGIALASGLFSARNPRQSTQNLAHIISQSLYAKPN